MEKSFGDLESAYPWDSLDGENYPEELRQRARIGWTENALNEYCAAAAMGQLVTALIEVKAPVDLIALASRFPSEEILHVILCARVAMRLGGGAPIVYDPESLAPPVSRELSPLQRANELVVRMCCVSEAFSFPMLRGSMQAATHPLTKAVLTRIVADERQHGLLGWRYLEWAQPRLDDEECRRLTVIAEATAEEFTEFWQRLQPGFEAFDALDERGRKHYHDMGWMAPRAYTELAKKTISEEVFGRLHAFGIGRL